MMAEASSERGGPHHTLTFAGRMSAWALILTCHYSCSSSQCQRALGSSREGGGLCHASPTYALFESVTPGVGFDTCICRPARQQDRGGLLCHACLLELPLYNTRLHMRHSVYSYSPSVYFCGCQHLQSFAITSVITVSVLCYYSQL